MLVGSIDMSWLRAGLLALLSLTIGPTREARPFDEPLARPDLRRPESPIGAPWLRRHERITAARVRLNGLGARTHANWVLWRLPFDVTDRDHIRGIDFTISSRERTDVAALIVGSICADFPTRGGIEEWSSYTTNGIAWTQRFGWHGAPPSDDPTILGLNVPTRVANYVACGWDHGALKDPEAWFLDLSWDER